MRASTTPRPAALAGSTRKTRVITRLLLEVGGLNVSQSSTLAAQGRRDCCGIEAMPKVTDFFYLLFDRSLLLSL
jgi:hypothetical protein